MDIEYKRYRAITVLRSIDSVIRAWLGIVHWSRIDELDMADTEMSSFLQYCEENIGSSHIMS